MKLKILSTKKLDPSLLEKAGERGWEMAEQEMIEIKSCLSIDTWKEIMNEDLAEKEYAVFTSAHAAETIKKYLHPYINPYNIRWKVFSLGGKTREGVEKIESLQDRVIGTADNATGLAELIISLGVKELVFFCGDQRRDELPDLLRNSGVAVQEIVVYQTIEKPVHVVPEFDAVLFFSPSAVRSFFRLNQLKEGAICFALGETTASELSKNTRNKIIVSSAPSQEKMLDALIKTYKV